MSLMPLGVGFHQMQLTKATKKNRNSINLMNSMNQSSKLSSAPVYQRPAVIQKELKPKMSKARLEKEEFYLNNQKSDFFNAKFKPHTIKILPQKRIKKSFLNQQNNEPIENLLRQNSRFSLDGPAISKKPQKSLTIHKKHSTGYKEIFPQKNHIPVAVNPIINNLTFSTASKFIFPKSRRVLTTQEQVLIKINNPGPAQYNPFRPEASNPSIKFGHENRLLAKINTNPGPGLYRYERSQLSKRGGVMFRQKRYTSCQSYSPGPAKYQTVSLNKTKQATNCTKLSIHRSSSKMFQQKLKWPGPGQYQVIQTLSNSRVLGGAIGKSRRDLEIQDTSPGPIYSPKYEQVLKKSPAFVYGKEIRETCETNIFHTNSSSVGKLRKTVFSGKNIRLSHNAAVEESPKVGSNLRSRSQMRKSMDYK